MKNMKIHSALKNLYSESEFTNIEPAAFDYVPAERRENHKKSR